MKKASNYQDPHGFELIAVEPGEDSPMQDHKGGDIAVDPEAKRFYVHEVFLIMWGLESVQKACHQYHQLEPAPA